MPDALLAPYLPLAQAVTVGPWRLVPFKAIDYERVHSGLRRALERLVVAYRVPGSGSTLGAVVYPAGTHIGAPFERSDLPRLRHALFVGAISGNPRIAVPEEEADPNGGHAVALAENALLYGHPLGDGDRYVTETGMLVRITSSRVGRGEKPLPPVPPPVELPKPIFVSFDDELAEAAYAALDTRDPAGRRLALALDWYGIALSNAEAVTLAVRVGATRTALEVLTDAGDKTGKLVNAYSRLVSEPDAPKVTYENETTGWAKGPVQLTSDGWWAACLCQLRNAIVHGDEVAEELWFHDGHPQLNHIHDRLIAALRITIANAAEDQMLRLEPADRDFRRRVAETLVHLQQHAAAEQDKVPRPRPD